VFILLRATVSLQASVVVYNNGRLGGEEVVQLYVGVP